MPYRISYISRSTETDEQLTSREAPERKSFRQSLRRSRERPNCLKTPPVTSS